MKTLYYQGFEETSPFPQRPALGPPLPALLNIFWPGVKPPERASPMKFWETNGSYQLRENKLVPDVPYSGIYSLRFSVTLDGGWYCYFEERLPKTKLLEKYRDTRLEAYLLPLDLNGVSFNIGYNVIFPNEQKSGCCAISPEPAEGKEWVKVSSVPSPYDRMKDGAEKAGWDWRGFYLDRWYLSFLGGGGEFSGQTVTAFVDDVRIFTP